MEEDNNNYKLPFHFIPGFLTGKTMFTLPDGIGFFKKCRIELTM